MKGDIENSLVQEDPPEDDPFQWVGHVLDGRYAVDALVGEGGFAVVYRGYHKGLDEAVAIKCLKVPRKLAGDERERFLRSFLDEGKLLYRLSRGNASIVRSLDVGVATSPNGNWTPYLVLEWLDGQTLEHDLNLRRRKGTARTLQAARVLLDPVARALGTAHAQGVAHRDIKPANLFLCTVDGERTVKVLDFGIAKVIADSTDLRRAHEATGASLQAFTPRYGAPEQFDRRFGATGPWTDVFALALILVETVLGRSAMQGEGVELFLTASNLHERPTLRTLGVDEGDAVERVLRQALAVHPQDRYATASAFWDALAKSMREGTSSTLSRPRVDPLAQTVPSARDILAKGATGDAHPEGAAAPIGSGRTPIAMVRTPLSADRAPSIRAAVRGGTLSSARFDRGEPMDPDASGESVPPPSAKPMLPWIGLAVAGVMSLVGGAWVFNEFTHEENHFRGLSFRGAARTSRNAAAFEPAPVAANAPAIACASGLIPYEDDVTGSAICMPIELQNAPVVDGTIRQGDIELRLRGGDLRPPDVTLETLFEREAADDATEGRSILRAKIEKGADSFSLAGTVRGKPFFVRTVTAGDRFAAVQLVYPESARKAIEPKLRFILPSFVRRAPAASNRAP